MRPLALALCALPCLFTPVFAQSDLGVTPAQIGEIFCVARLADDPDLLDGLLSDELRTQIAYAEARNDRLARAFPDDKPPLGDGIPWASFPDRAETCMLGSVATEGASARVVITYGFGNDPAAEFADTLELVQRPHPYDPDRGQWRLNDIRYTTSGTLGEALHSLFEGL